MAKRPTTAADTVFKIVTASTKNPNDTGRNHCFEQDEKWDITFKAVVADQSVNSIYFVLWNPQSCSSEVCRRTAGCSC
jgi:hypothetical protein